MSYIDLNDMFSGFIPYPSDFDWYSKTWMIRIYTQREGDTDADTRVRESDCDDCVYLKLNWVFTDSAISQIKEKVFPTPFE